MNGDVAVILKRFDAPEETRVFEKGRLEIVRIGGMTLARATYEPGWKWSQHVGPGVGAARCEVEHLGMVLSGHGDGRVRGRPRHRADRRLSLLRPGRAARQLGRRQPPLRVAPSAGRGALREVSSGPRPTRAVILAGGRGTRMQKPDAAASLSAAQAAAADEGSKGMMPIHGRPFLDYVLSSLAEAGIEEVCLVTPPGGSAIRAHYGRPARRRVSIAFAEQPSPRGSGDALLAAEPFARDQDFVALNSDNLYPVSAIRALRALDGSGLAVFERERLLATSNFTRERVAAFATLRVSAEGWLEAIVEKPLASRRQEAGGRREGSPFCSA